MTKLDKMKEYLIKNEGKDLITSAHNFKQLFDVTDRQLYFIWFKLGYADKIKIV